MDSDHVEDTPRTIGRKSGLRRTTALTYARDERVLLVVASAGGAPSPPGWLLNLEAWPEAEVQIGRDTHRVRARVTTLADPDYARRWLLMDAVNDGRYTVHQQKTARIIPIVELAAVPPQP
ncbi:nitroreductase/quinone reductase family protein [Nocardia colli]|uniref:nitroreductase/quinone reductase family protein n=1 Tax=Nocardia colli TaxID=2545717 RepID=UPI0035E17F4E